jgi:hypothetical protein
MSGSVANRERYATGHGVSAWYPSAPARCCLSDSPGPWR